MTARPRFLSSLVVWAMAVGLLLAGCYDTESIVAVAISPDGARVAVLTDRGELGVLDLREPGPLTIFSHYARRGMAWSPDSRRIAFVEQLPGEPSNLWALNLETGQRGPRPLMGGTAWKAEPAWLSDQTLAFLCDQDADAADIWLVGVQADGAPDRPFRLLDPKADASRLWGSPEGPSLYYQSAAEGESALWRWRPGAEQTVMLLMGLTDGFDGRNGVSFGPRFERVGAIVEDGAGDAATWFDLEDRREVARLPLTRTVIDIQALSDGRVALSQNDRIAIWDPDAGLLQRKVVETRWRGAPVRAFDELEPGGLVAVVHGNLLLTAPDADDLESGELHVRLNEDVIRLAWEQAVAGRTGEARRLLRDLRESAPEGSQARPVVAIALAVLERLNERWRRADARLVEAIKAAVPGSVEAHLARVERLALAFFDRRDTRAAVAAMVEIANSPMEPEIAAPTRPLVDWVQALLTSKDERLQRQWQAIGGRVRQGDYDRAARDLRRAMQNDAWTTHNLTGLRVVIEGALDPIEQAVGSGPPRALEPLMQQVDFQETLMLALRLNSEQGPSAADLRSLLMEQWVLRGDASLARQLVREDLADDPAGSVEPYLDLLRQYLVAEERPPWLDRVVTDTLLEAGIAAALFDPLRDVEDRLSLRLAQTRAALIGGRNADAQIHLAEAWVIAAGLPPEAVSIERVTRGRQAEGPSAQTEPGGAEAAFRQIQLVYLMELYQAKISEAQGKWSDALRAYRACLALMDKVPADWDVAPYEVTLSISLIEQGSAEPERLQSLLRVRRQLGDPLLEPTRDPARVRQALENIAALRASQPEPWLAQHLELAEGLGLSVLRRPEHALAALGRARGMNPPAAVLQRVLLEEAALRDSIGQSSLAARIYGRIMGLRGMSLSVRAAAVVALIHAEQSSGIATEPEDRLLQLMPGDALPQAWREWLWLQVGAPAGPEQAAHIVME